MFVDPWGLDATLTGTDEFKQQVFDAMQLLTRDTLSYEIDYLGNWIVSYESVEKDDRNVGTDLVRRIIDNKYEVVIKRGYFYNGNLPHDLEDAAIAGKGSGSVLFFNPDAQNKFPTEVIKEGTVKIEEIEAPIQITLGHELIHTLRAMGGNYIPNDKDIEKGLYHYRGKNGELLSKFDDMEELATTGISYVRPDGSFADAGNWVTTENSLRAEQNCGRRVRYGK